MNWKLRFVYMKWNWDLSYDILSIIIIIIIIIINFKFHKSFQVTYAIVYILK
jgi:hypothetical protein